MNTKFQVCIGFLFGQEVPYKPTNTSTSENKNILPRLLASRGFDFRDYEDFLEDLEEDPLVRENINIYKDEKQLTRQQQDVDDDDDEVPEISLEEMLDDLNIQDVNME